MKFIFDEDGHYTDEIAKSLRAYNRLHTGDKKSYGRHFYIESDGELIAGMTSYLSWDWVRIGDVKYDSLEVLRELVEAVSDYYKEDALGIKFDSNIEDKVMDLKEVGFTLIDKIKFSPNMTNYYYLEMRTLKLLASQSNVTVFNEPIEAFDKILKDSTKASNIKYAVEKPLLERTLVVYDETNFVGGVYGVIYSDHVYIDMLVVEDDYKGQSFGREIMERFEAALPKNITTISLGTTEFQARGFYELLGYKVVAISKEFVKGYDAYTMVKEV